MDKNNKDVLPPKVKIKASNIPQKLKSLPHWGLWQWQFVRDQWTKVPVDSSGNSVDARTFSDKLPKTLKIFKKLNIRGGVGFIFTSDHNILGIDLDDCVVDGVIDKAVRLRLKELNTYWERSPSGTGIHIMGKGSSKLNGVEKKYVYSDSRFFTFTGHGEGRLRNISKKVNKLYKRKESERVGSTGEGSETDISFVDLQRIVMNIRPDISEPDWFNVCKAIHNKTGGSDKGFELFHSWSMGSYCEPDQMYQLKDESPEHREKEIERKWNRCRGNKSKMVGVPTLRELEEFYPVIVKIRKDLFKKTLDTLKYNSQELDVTCLPKRLRVAAKESSRFNKVPVDPVITTMLMTFSAAINKKVIIEERGGREHNCSMGCVIGMSTGGRKSAIDQDLMKPYFNFENNQESLWQSSKIINEQRVRLWKKRHKETEKQIDESNEASGIDELDETQVEIMASIQKKINSYQVPRPKFIESDVTEERLSDVLHKNNETIFIQSDDARNTITNITGRYDATSENIYISGITGSPYRRSRVKDDIEIVLKNPCINMSLKVQLDKLVSLVADDAIRESGLIARLFLKIVEVDAGEQVKETAKDKDLDVSKMDYYNELLQGILEYDGKPVRVQLSPKAIELRRAFTQEYANLIEGQWKDNFDVSNKIVTLSVKMATVIRIIRDKNCFVKANSLFGPPRMEIRGSDYLCGKEIVKVLMNQTLDVLNQLERNALIEGAKDCMVKIKEFLENTGQSDFNYTDIYNKYGKTKRDLVNQWLNVLYESGLIRKKGKRFKVV